MVKNPTGYLADKIGFDKVVLYNGETQTVTPLVLAGDVDYATHGFPTATEQQYKDMGIRITARPRTAARPSSSIRTFTRLPSLSSARLSPTRSTGMRTARCRWANPARR